jgi:hypothetical protein
MSTLKTVLIPKYKTEANITMILDEAEKLYSKLVKGCIYKPVEDVTNKTITDVASNSESSSLANTV